MSSQNIVGTVIIEALKEFKNSVPLMQIVLKVASILECPEQMIVNFVTQALEGGVHYGYIEQRGNKFRFSPINLLRFTAENSLYKVQKTNIYDPIKASKARNHQSSPITSKHRQRDAMHFKGLGVRRSASTCIFNSTILCRSASSSIESENIEKAVGDNRILRIRTHPNKRALESLLSSKPKWKCY